MTREEILATTYPLPTPEIDQNYLQADAHYQSLRALVDYESPPPAFMFEGPGRSVPSLRRSQRYVADMRHDLQAAFKRGRVSRLAFETEEQRNVRHLQALEKAIPMAEAGWEIYTCEDFLAVLVLPE
jgi:hypothetical protein